MSVLTLQLDLYRKYVRIRYPLFVILIIFLIFFIPYTLEYDASWTPYRSIENKGDYGQSTLNLELQRNYKTSVITSSLKDNLPTEFESSKLIIINAPEFKYKGADISNLWRFINRGGHLLLLGTTNAITELVGYFGFSYDTQSGVIYDRKNNYGNSSLIEINFGDNSYLSVSPYSLYVYNEFENFDNLITSSPTSITYSGIKSNNIEQMSRVVGVVESRDFSISNYYSEISILADNWMFSNSVLDLNPDNINLLLDLINSVSNDIDEIIFDETHYDYLPINHIGVENLFYRHFINTNVMVLLLIFSVVIPLIIASRTGLLSNISEVFTDSNLSQRIAKRLETLHLKNTPAVPLTYEERFLTEHRLEMLQRGKYYFQYVTNHLIEYITKENLTEHMDPQIMKDLEWTKNNIAQDESVWNLIEEVNIQIKLAEIKILENALDFNQ